MSWFLKFYLFFFLWTDLMLFLPTEPLSSPLFRVYLILGLFLFCLLETLDFSIFVIYSYCLFSACTRRLLLAFYWSSKIICLFFERRGSRLPLPWFKSSFWYLLPRWPMMGYIIGYKAWFSCLTLDLPSRCSCSSHSILASLTIILGLAPGNTRRD